ncbi:hypothetical protein SDC9_152400 [bioreactor metagenome]|uniref:Uncharacterized protein n=1 Tax=bioreactor metagenome TaxID=1076179 RepID=A0A645EUM1_9ZZZZ
MDALVEQRTRAVQRTGVHGDQASRLVIHPGDPDQGPAEPLLGVVRDKHRQHGAGVDGSGLVVGRVMSPGPHVFWPVH